MRLNNEANVKAVHIKCEAKATLPEKGPAKLSFLAYSGDSVDLSDYGFDYPVVYKVSGIVNKQKIPILYNHGEAVGHTTKVNKLEGETKLGGRGYLSLPGAATSKIEEGLKNGFPFEGSMGLRIDNWNKDISFHAKDPVVVNGRTFQAPIYVVEKSKMVEMTVTEFGRDGETSFELLNEERRMTIKNAAPPVDDKQVLPPEDKKVDNKEPEDKKVENKAPEDKKVEEKKELPSDVLNSAKSLIRVQKLLNTYKDSESLELVEKGLENGWDDDRIKNEIELVQLRNQLPKLPSGGAKENKATFYNTMAARVALSNGMTPEGIAKKWGKEVADNVYEQGVMGPFELCVSVANHMGGNYTGFSDADVVCKFIKNSGFSTFSMPNLFEDVGKAQLEERWTLNPPFAVQHLKEGSNPDFRTTSKIRPSGGEMWDKLSADGKISHTSFGKETRYTTELDTKAQMIVFDRPTIINDDRDVLATMMDSMLEGAMMVPDYKLGMKMLAQASAANTFWVDTVNSFTSTALTRANLSTRYTDVRQYNETRGLVWNTIINGNWKLIHGPSLEETAWEILKQDYIVNDTTANTKTGSKNYWFNKFEMAMFAQMGNTSALGSTGFVASTAWLLWPKEVRFSPYEITYLRGKKRPTIESVDLPGDMLGFGTRGYWDVEVNERENTAIVRCKA